MYDHFVRHTPCLGWINTDLPWPELEFSDMSILKCILCRHGVLSTRGRHTWKCRGARVVTILRKNRLGIRSKGSQFSIVNETDGFLVFGLVEAGSEEQPHSIYRSTRCYLQKYIHTGRDIHKTGKVRFLDMY